MIRCIAILFILSSAPCLAQQSYESTLALRVQQIRELSYYDAKILTAVDSVDYHDASYPYWKPNDTYYEDDIARHKYRSYRALRETKGERPGASSAAWALMSGPHPYLFLKDTARLEDVRKLLSDNHPYVRAYAFGALSQRTQENMFPVIMDNMKDTTAITAAWGDSGFNVYPAELMISYQLERLSRKQKQELKKLISTQYPHFEYCKHLLIER